MELDDGLLHSTRIELSLRTILLAPGRVAVDQVDLVLRQARPGEHVVCSLLSRWSHVRRGHVRDDHVLACEEVED